MPETQRQGYEAFWAEAQVADCPYTPEEDMALYQWWLDGYLMAYDEYCQVAVDYA